MLTSADQTLDLYVPTAPTLPYNSIEAEMKRPQANGLNLKVHASGCRAGQRVHGRLQWNFNLIQGVPI
jgi:hypothetical protein